MEKYRERQRDMHLAFIDPEKAYDSVPHELIWKTLFNKGASRRYIKVIKDMYDDVKTRIAHNKDLYFCIGDKILQSKESFRYLGSMLHKSGRIGEDVYHRIKAAWLKLECWPITKALANRMEVAELRMLRWTCGKTMLDMIPNGVYRAELKVETIINKMRGRTVEVVRSCQEKTTVNTS
ncbi:hypothetical protein Tco_0794296 [Tanacetum coccineum]